MHTKSFHIQNLNVCRYYKDEVADRLCKFLQAAQQVAKSHYDVKVQPTTLIPKQVGNMYTASLYAAFASLIHNKHSTLVCSSPISKFRQSEINFYYFCSKCIIYLFQNDKRVIMFSYGSGLSSTMFSFRLREGQHPFSLSNIANVMNVDEKLKSRNEVFFSLA